MCILQLIGSITSNSDLYIYCCIACQWRTGRIFVFAKLSCLNLGSTLQWSLPIPIDYTTLYMPRQEGWWVPCVFSKRSYIFFIVGKAAPNSFKDYHNEPNHSAQALCCLVVALLWLALSQGLILHLQSRGFETVPIASPLFCSRLCDPDPLVHVLKLIIQKDWPFKKTAEMNRALYGWGRRLATGLPLKTA
jgi:hypothetical protein